MSLFFKPIYTARTLLLSTSVDDPCHDYIQTSSVLSSGFTDLNLGREVLKVTISTNLSLDL